MSSSSSDASKGLGHSKPLVSVSNVHSGVKRSTGTSLTATSTPAGADHPLATPSLLSPVPSTSTSAVPPRETVSSPTLPSVTSPTIAAIPNLTTPPTSPPSTQHFNSPSPAVVSPSSSALSLDSLADDFLSGPSVRTQTGHQPLLRPLPLPQHELGILKLRTLVVRRAWGDVLQVAGDILRSSNSPHAPVYASLISKTEEDSSSSNFSLQLQQETVEALTLECQAWLKLRRYADLGTEVERWNFINKSKPSWVPWSLYILAAESLQYTDPASKRCTDALYSLREKCAKEPLWVLAVNVALSNVFCRQKEWRMALTALDDFLNTLEKEAASHIVTSHFGAETLSDAERQWATSLLSTAYQCEGLSRQARLLLQVGALPEAGQLMDRAQSAWTAVNSSPAEGVSPTIQSKVASHWILQHIPGQLRVNDGLLAFAHGNYQQAMASFSSAIEQQRTVYKSHSLEYLVDHWMGPLGVDPTHSVLAQCWNNMALCSLYSCNMKDAVNMMECIVKEDPTAFLTERLAFNLCTLYELGSDTATSARRKRILQLIAKRFFLHDIGPESFRVS